MTGNRDAPSPERRRSRTLPQTITSQQLDDKVGVEIVIAHNPLHGLIHRRAPLSSTRSHSVGPRNLQLWTFIDAQGTAEADSIRGFGVQVPGGAPKMTWGFTLGLLRPGLSMFYPICAGETSTRMPIANCRVMRVSALVIRYAAPLSAGGDCVPAGSRLDAEGGP